jgi:tRNA modification GTPase
MNDQSTICAVATAPGIGGIAVIRLSGSESVLIADKIYQPLSKGKRLIDQSPNSMHYGNVVSENTILDDAFSLYLKRLVLIR